MANQYPRKLVIDVTYTFDETGTQAKLNRVGNSVGDDITDDFRLLAHQLALPLTTQQEIEHATREFVAVRKDVLP